MARNDVILLDSILQKHGQDHGLNDIGKIFDEFTANQILKKHDLSLREIQQGIVDGSDDGGIDMFYVFVNGILLSTENDFVAPRYNCSLEVVLVTCKHAEEFCQEPINVMYPSVDELFDLRKADSQLQGKYNDGVLQQRRLYIDAYKKVAYALVTTRFTIIYASRGDSDKVTENVQARANQICETLHTLFSESEVSFSFVGAKELLTMYRQRMNVNLSLPIQSYAARNKGSFVVLAKLTDYYNFITDNGVLRKYLFDSNVREFLGQNDVNDAIKDSLENCTTIDFWFLNNGVTILASNAISAGDEIKIENVQIVNGLQTSYSIYQYFNSFEDRKQSDNRTIVVKIISQSDAQLRDAIIRSTNNQSAIQMASLFATDKVQRDIEDILSKNGFYYERRKNCFDGKEIDYSKVFDILSIAKGYLSVIDKVPEKAANFKQKWLTDDIKYNVIFGPQNSIMLWPRIANLLYLVEKEFRMNRSQYPDYSEGFLRRSRGVVELLVASIVLGKIDFQDYEFLKLDESKLTSELIREVWEFVAVNYDRRLMLRRGYIIRMCLLASEKWNITGFPRYISKQGPFVPFMSGSEFIPEEYKKYVPWKEKSRRRRKE